MDAMAAGTAAALPAVVAAAIPAMPVPPVNRSATMSAVPVRHDDEHAERDPEQTCAPDGPQVEGVPQGEREKRDKCRNNPFEQMAKLFIEVAENYPNDQR